MSKPVVPDDLGAFVQTAKGQGVADTDLVGLLRQHGWSDRRAYAALSQYYTQKLRAIPERGGAAESARDAFLYLLAFATLATWTVALVWLAYVLIDHAVPSALDSSYYGSFRESVAGQLASLIVAFPIFMAVSAAIVRQTRSRPESLESGVRKWLTYVALVITAVIMLGDGVWFLTQFLLGDLTLRFALKAFVLFAVAGGVLWYYLGSVSTEQHGRSRDAAFGWSAAALITPAIILGFTGIGTPAHNRSVSYDEQRVSDLQSLAYDVDAVYRAAHNRLPASLAGVAVNDAAMLRDPVTHQPYRYERDSDSVYRLCAVFDAARSSAGRSFWQHTAGGYCFRLAAAAPVPAT